MSAEEQNKQTITRLYEEVWQSRNADALDEFYAPGDYLDGLKQFARSLFGAFPDWQMAIADLIAEGSKVVVYWTGRGTQQGAWQGLDPSGLPTSVRGIDIDTLADGRIVREDGVIDMLAMLRQLGAVLVSV